MGGLNRRLRTSISLAEQCPVCDLVFHKKLWLTINFGVGSCKSWQPLAALTPGAPTCSAAIEKRDSIQLTRSFGQCFE